MSPNDDTIIYQNKELKGSRLRCLMLTNLPNKQVADFLNGLVSIYAVVNTNDFWMPRGFLESAEAKLGESSGFLSDEHRKIVTDWWLAVKKGANTPNWDVVSTCTVAGEPGLLLIEAKAHEGELNVTTDNCGSQNGDNQAQIESAIKEANAKLCSVHPGWSLLPNRCYQLSNRFAWAWKVASMGVPVVLVYLGFLNAVDMDNSGRTILASSKQWYDCVLRRSHGIVPPKIWNQKLEIGKVPIVILIRSAEVNILASGCTRNGLV